MAPARSRSRRPPGASTTREPSASGPDVVGTRWTFAGTNGKRARAASPTIVVMTKLDMFVVAFLALSACGGGEDGKLVGVWTGTAAGYSVTADIEAEYASAGNLSLQGVMSTDRPACFTNAM